MSVINEKALGEGSLNKLMFKMAVPTIVAQIINILYNIVDRIYIGHIPGASASALTGVGVALPIVVFISAFSAFVGQGGAPLSSIWLGKGDKDHAEKILGNGTFLFVLFTIILMLVFYIWQKPLLYAFGASDATISYASIYLSWYLVGTIFVEIALGLNTYIIAQGNPGVAMGSVLVGAIVNIILDPLFIFVFNMEVKGAAIATVISQGLSAIWVIYFLTSKKALLRIRFKYMKPDFKIIKPIFSLGISPFVMRATESLISIVMNRGLQKYGGDIYVASLTIMQSVMQFFSAPVGGFTQGVQPVISYNYGAQNFKRVRQAYKKMILVCGSFSFAGTVVVMVFPGIFAKVFYRRYRSNRTCMPEDAFIYVWNASFWSTDGNTAYIPCTWTSQNLTYNSYVKKSNTAYTACNYISNVFGCRRGIPGRTSIRFYICNNCNYVVFTKYK